MAKLKRLSTEGITSDLFNGTRSYGAALWAIEICNRIIDRVNAGDIVFCYENIIKPEFELRWEADEFKGLFLKDAEHAWAWIVGDVREDTGKIACRKYDIREYFKLWRVAKITDVSRVTDLTK